VKDLLIDLNVEGRTIKMNLKEMRDEGVDWIGLDSYGSG
jgi:hypothetical protein